MTKRERSNRTCLTPALPLRPGMALEDIRSAVAHGEDRTDWQRVDAQADEQIEAAVAADATAAPLLSDEFWRTATMLADAASAEKIMVSMRLDRDVVEAFKTEGPGYQSRINAVLRTAAVGGTPAAVVESANTELIRQLATQLDVMSNVMSQLSGTVATLHAMVSAIDYQRNPVGSASEVYGAADASDYLHVPRGD